MAENKKKRRGLFVILVAIGALALLLIAAAFAGYQTGITWFDNWFGNGASSASAGGGGTLANDGGAGGDGAGGGNGCFLGIICLNGSTTADGVNANASVDDDGVSADGSNE